MSPLWVSNFYTIALPTHDNVTITLLLVQCSLYSEEIDVIKVFGIPATDKWSVSYIDFCCDKIP